MVVDVNPLDPHIFPHIVDTVFALADLDSLLALRTVSRSFQDKADTRIFARAVVHCAYTQNIDRGLDTDVFSLRTFGPSPQRNLPCLPIDISIARNPLTKSEPYLKPGQRPIWYRLVAQAERIKSVALEGVWIHPSSYQLGILEGASPTTLLVTDHWDLPRVDFVPDTSIVDCSNCSNPFFQDWLWMAWGAGRCRTRRRQIVVLDCNKPENTERPDVCSSSFGSIPEVVLFLHRRVVKEKAPGGVVLNVAPGVMPYNALDCLATLAVAPTATLTIVGLEEFPLEWVGLEGWSGEITESPGDQGEGEQVKAYMEALRGRYEAAVEKASSLVLGEKNVAPGRHQQSERVVLKTKSQWKKEVDKEVRDMMWKWW
jgi:hypothetical protein